MNIEATNPDTVKSSPGAVSTEAAPQCQHMVARKKRLCRMTVRPGRNYCGEHDRNPSLDPTASTKIDNRIPCPLDPKHTCYASKLEKHLKVCNARCDSSPAYIRKGCNTGGGDEPSEKEEQKLRLKDVSEEKLKAVISLVERLYTEHVHNHIVNLMEGEEEAVHPAVLSDYQLEERGRNTRRHLRQTSSLLHRLEREGLVQPACCYVELGAGRGRITVLRTPASCRAKLVDTQRLRTPDYRHLSYYLSRAIEGITSSSVVLVDRASHRHKQDNKLERERHSVARLRADIADLQLAEAEHVRAAAAVVALSKHLCGLATDLALRCVTAPDVRDKTRGVVMATCCHHRCSAAQYVATDYLEEKGVTREYFNIMMGIVSWATCGSGFSRERRSREVPASKRQKTQAEHDTEAVSECDVKRDENKRNAGIETKLDDTATKAALNDGDVPGNNDANENGGISDSKLLEAKKDISLLSCGNTSGAGREEKLPLISNSSERNISRGDKKLISGSDDSNLNIIQDKVVPDRVNSVSLTNGNIAVTDVRLGLTVERRTEIGRRAKALLDHGRVEYLRKCGFEAKLCYYVGVDVSPENVCIVAKKLCQP